MRVSGFLNYIGFELRSFQIRFFWPIYLSLFVGFGIYVFFKFIVKKWNFIYTSVIVLLFMVLVGGIVKLPVLKQTDVQKIPSIPYVNTVPNQGIMDPYHWEALNWVSDNTGTDAVIYFFYGDIYSQDALLRNAKRIHYQVDPNDFVKALQERKIKKSYVSELPGDSGTGAGITIREGLFKFEPVTKSLPREYFLGPKDICTFDYLIFDKVSSQEVLAQYNLLIASELIKKDYINKVFENEGVIILKNENKGADCIEERTF